MKSQYLSYVQTKRITDWKRLVITKGNLIFLYGSNDSKIFAKIPSNSILWIIESHPQRPPSLVAKLNVASIQLLEEVLDTDPEKFRHYKEFKWIALCKKTSVFFGYNNVENELSNLYFENSIGIQWKLGNQAFWSSDFGRKLQGTKRISNSAYAKNPVFNKYVQHEKPSIFMSWKWKDTSYEWIKELAYKLSDAGYIIWLDILVLPRSKALNIVASDSKKLEKLLKYGYSHSEYLLAIDSANYGIKSRNSQKNWTLREWNGKLAAKNIFKKILVKSSSKKKSPFMNEADFVIEKNDINGINEAFQIIDKLVSQITNKNNER